MPQRLAHGTHHTVRMEGREVDRQSGSMRCAGMLSDSGPLALCLAGRRAEGIQVGRIDHHTFQSSDARLGYGLRCTSAPGWIEANELGDVRAIVGQVQRVSDSDLKHASLGSPPTRLR